jgi:hypothetical protein
MKSFKKSAAVTVGVLGLTLGLGACQSDSDVVSKNISKDSDNYKVARQIVVYDAIQGKYILQVRGFCSLGNNDKPDRVSYTCKASGEDSGYLKDIILKSDNTFVFVHQLNPAQVSKNHVKVILKPSTVIPNFEAR